MSISELLAIYTSQTMGNIAIPRFSIFSTDGLQIASYFGGETHKDMAILVLDDNEDPKIFKDGLIHFYHLIIKGHFDQKIIETKIQDLFSIVQEQNEQTQAQFTSLERKFDTYLDIFKDFIEILDMRMKNLENNILKLSLSMAKGDKDGS